MFEAISRLFTQTQPTDQRHEPKLAVAALLVHLAAVDGSVKDEEREAVKAALMDNYALEEAEVDQLIADATRRDSDAVDFYRFTSSLTALEEAERIEIIRMMWQVVFADKKNHELEDNMVWRIAELIGVSSRQRTILRNQMAKA
ncbi:MAG: TerB family tellurite resistance protein [Devosia nanyangense]|uniref:TerB family tellurite resistance protein n=1 Tax=Devosia nanyangense TaxID=1228055 RepID=A0A933L1X0_9HYPH|nr:TerB family tellurite resistance protein [Devosia nanyangense]